MSRTELWPPQVHPRLLAALRRKPGAFGIERVEAAPEGDDWLLSVFFVAPAPGVARETVPVGISQSSIHIDPLTFLTAPLRVLSVNYPDQPGGPLKVLVRAVRGERIGTLVGGTWHGGNGSAGQGKGHAGNGNVGKGY